ncbi:MULTISPECIES: amphi-Trp domain-containing protein [unclassified Streptomyces]|uniref:amphi-Trp domain-containing protein n=1 Tax=unclassified Streptomyces TaxID=2593676 RepID=UPI00225500BB|nr:MULTISPECIES: amphi-Trp domain-containing protein [unclassified Streptomyces]MCX5441495.1 amphi-Trp domain-containing protein [Streptomyces sp. NBC_00063]WSE18740.1 amphi-Trp domain-containing protein [Streptomyces sp. NBC_01397]WUB92213.1 amphi-Trp domain-containing protein [Streptomyces sp. NBC_00569]
MLANFLRIPYAPFVAIALIAITAFVIRALCTAPSPSEQWGRNHLAMRPGLRAVPGSETPMRDLKFEQKRTLSRLEAADQLTAFADALRKGGDAELELGAGTLSLRLPDDLRSEIEVEVGDGEIELEIEFKWPTASARTASSRTTANTREATARKSAPAKPRRSTTGAGGSERAKRSAKRAAKAS